MAGSSAFVDSPEAVWSSAERAYGADAPYKATLDDIYELILPLRKREASKGAPRMDRAYDSTAVRSAMRFAGRLQMDLMPPFQPWFQLQNGLAAKAKLSGPALKRRAKFLERVTALAFAAIDNSAFHTAANEMCTDLVAGQGALLVKQGELDDPLIFEAVPSDQIAIVDGPNSRVSEIHYKKSYTYKDFCEAWPDGARPKKVRDALSKPDKEKAAALQATLDVLQATLWDAGKKRWVHLVLVQDENAILEVSREATRACPWITPRFYKVPGEARGRGPAWLALPDVRVANKTVELTLRAAALAILGIWTRTASLNGTGQLDMSRIKPGTVINVARNAGGVGGPSIQPLDTPRSFDVSNVILHELRESIRETLFDRAIPRANGTPRSASEILEAVRIHAEDLAASYGRLVTEIVIPLVKRVLEILHSLQLVSGEIEIDQLFTEVKITSALAQAQNMMKVRVITQWLEVISSVLPQEAVLLAAKLEEMGAEIGRLMGVPEKLMRSTDEGKALQQMIGAIVARQQGAPPQSDQTAA